MLFEEAYQLLMSIKKRERGGEKGHELGNLFSAERFLIKEL